MGKGGRKDRRNEEGGRMEGGKEERREEGGRRKETGPQSYKFRELNFTYNLNEAGTGSRATAETPAPSDSLFSVS